METRQVGGLSFGGVPDIKSIAKDIKSLAASIPQAKEAIIEQVQQEVNSRVSAGLAQAGLSSDDANSQNQTPSEEYLEEVYEGGGDLQEESYQPSEQYGGNEIYNPEEVDPPYMQEGSGNIEEDSYQPSEQYGGNEMYNSEEVDPSYMQEGSGNIEEESYQPSEQYGGEGNGTVEEDSYQPSEQYGGNEMYNSEEVDPSYSQEGGDEYPIEESFQNATQENGLPFIYQSQNGGYYIEQPVVYDAQKGGFVIETPITDYIENIQKGGNETSPSSENDNTNDYEFNDPSEEEISNYVGGKYSTAASKSARRRRPYSLTKKISSVTIKEMASHKSTRKGSRKNERKGSRKAERKGSRKAERKGSRKAERKNSRKGSRRNNGGYGGM